VILSEAARKILAAQLDSHRSAWVFPQVQRATKKRDAVVLDRPYSREQVGKVFRRAARGAGLEDFHFHAPRRDGGAQSRLHGADRDGARRLEDGADDAPVRGGHRSDAPGRRGGGEWR
jgi:integrase